VTVSSEVRELSRAGHLFTLVLVVILVILLGCGRVFTVGTINVNATLDGTPWSGAVDFTVKKSGGGTDNSSAVPKSWSQMPTGTYTLHYNSGGPSGATLASITPSATQTLSSAGTVTFTLNFSSEVPQ
jgi:hypothetical protein